MSPPHNTRKYLPAEAHELASIDVPYMGNIAQLPEAVFNSLRSSTNLSDFAQIIEELISNSIDAGSTKVQVSIDVESSYIKVEDDGCGVKRDDLTLLGERHATSKLHTLADLNVGVKTLGFRGEALSSLSDVSLLEVTTRAHGSPNTYTKIIKGCKCLSLGLSRSIRGLGTTVIARDVFYSQPVRRRLFQSSPKKVMQSVREHVLRIALMHPQVEFIVIDADREEEAIHTVPATSPICTVSSIFGNELANNLHEIDFAKGELRLSGYLSRSPNQLSSKVAQFFYINSRFVHKTPIHKLLNKSSTRINSILVTSEDELDHIVGANGKPVKDSCERHLYPAYILNLICPLSSYDMTYEVSKTMVEFKEWADVISFVDEVLQQTWGKFPDNSSHRTSRFGLSQSNAKSTPRKRKIWQHIDPTYRISRKTEAGKPLKNDNHLSAMEACCKRKHRELLEESFSEISHMQMHQRIEQQTNEAALLEFSCLDEVPEITCDSIQWSPQQICRPKEENTPPPQMDVFSIKSKDEECNKFPEIEWENQVLGSDMEIPGRRQMKFKTMSDLLHIDDNEALSSLYSNMNKDLFSEVVSAGKRMNSVLAPVSGNKNLLSEVRFEWENREYGNSNVPHWSGNRAPRNDGKHLYPSQISCSFLSPATIGRTPLTRKLEALKWGDGDHSTHKEMDWPRAQECLEIGSLISEEYIPFINGQSTVSPKSCMYSEVDSLHTSRGNHLGVNGSVTLDQETESFNDKYDLETRDNEETSYCDNSDNLLKASWLYFEDGVDSHQSKVGRTGKVARDVNERHEGNHESQPDALTSKTGDFSNMDSQFYNFGLDHPYSSKFREMAPAVLLYGKSKDYSQNGLEFRYETEMESERFRRSSPKSIKRSMSAPPFYKSRRKYGLHINSPYGLSTITRNRKHYSDCSKLSGKHLSTSDFQNELESICRDVQESYQLATDIQEKEQPVDVFEQSEPLLMLDNINSLPENENTMSKWRTTEVLPSPMPLSVIESTGNLLREWKQTCVTQNWEDVVLDVSSGALYLSNSCLVPESISKDCFMKANVLQQLDRKYIAIVAQGNLAVIDQHAADERIRLEQLRKEVLKGEERKKVTFLESEEELVLPVGGVQLLQNYSDQIEKWGWRYKIVSQNQGHFRRKVHQLQRSSCKAILTAVPCILGVNLTAEDLSEYIQQLVQTDGSSAAPPAILRILNFKSCRGAIMFGDTLLRSECALIVEELKRTSLCFQCAHGRPTTVPLVNLEALHKQLIKFDKASQSSERLLDKPKMTSGHASIYQSECWHGLRKHRATLERAKMRLN